MKLVKSSASFTRPSDTTQYAQNDLVANSTTAGSVVPMPFFLPSQGLKIWRVALFKTSTTITNAAFRLHLYADSPTVANGDNGALSTSTSGYQGFIDIAAAAVANTDDYLAHGVYVNNSVFAPMYLVADKDRRIYGLLQNTAATGYIPASAEGFTVTLLGESYA